MSTERPLRVLYISASARQENSVSRTLAADLIAALGRRHGTIEVAQRDLSHGVPFIDSDWVAANFTPAGERDAAQRRKLSYSDTLVAEIEKADVLVIGAPIYNFSVPAVLKAWIDMIARTGLTFAYTKDGPQGLLEGKKAYVVVPSGGVPIGAAMDFATPYLRHALGFVGITDVAFVGAAGADRDDGDALDDARMRIAELVHLAPQAA